MNLQWVSLLRSKLFLLIIFLLLPFGCGKSVRNTGQFEPYVQAFEADSIRLNQPTFVNSLEIKFGPLPAKTLGLCTISLGNPLITINQDQWTTLLEWQKQLVIYHELGHCILKKTHDNDTINAVGQRMDYSIMNSHPLDLIDYNQFRDDYLKELFNAHSGYGL